MEPAALINKLITLLTVSCERYDRMYYFRIVSKILNLVVSKISSLLLFLSLKHSKYELTGSIKTISIAQLWAAAAFRQIRWRDRL